jgi:hypothetical protein
MTNVGAKFGATNCNKLKNSFAFGTFTSQHQNTTFVVLEPM